MAVSCLCVGHHQNIHQAQSVVQLYFRFQLKVRAVEECCVSSPCVFQSFPIFFMAFWMKWKHLPCHVSGQTVLLSWTKRPFSPRLLCPGLCCHGNPQSSWQGLCIPVLSHCCVCLGESVFFLCTSVFVYGMFFWAKRFVLRSSVLEFQMCLQLPTLLIKHESSSLNSISGL